MGGGTARPAGPNENSRGRVRLPADEPPETVLLKEAQKGLLFTGVLKILVPFIIIVPGVIGYYYYGDSMYETQDHVYPILVKKVLPLGLSGFFAAVVMGAVLSTFNSVLNSAATIFSLDVYKRHINKEASQKRLVWIGRSTSSILAFFAIISAPLVAGAPDGLYQLLQQLNGIFFITCFNSHISTKFLTILWIIQFRCFRFSKIGTGNSAVL